MDGRRNNGGHSTKGFAGRKPKAEEQALIEKLSPLEEAAFKALTNGIKDGAQWAVKMFFEYMYGKPKETVHQSGEMIYQLVEKIADSNGHRDTGTPQESEAGVPREEAV